MNNRLSNHHEKQTDLPMLTINGRTTLPIVQGGMGVGISNWRLAGAVAREGGIGTLSAVGLPMTPAYKPLYDEAIRKWKEENNTTHIPPEIKNQIFYDVNLVCIKEEVRKARELSGGNGSIYINIMAATNDYDRQVKAACEAGIDGIVSGAGLPPLSLHEITKDYPETAIIPILSSARGVRIFLKKWMKKGRIPNAIILEDPSRAAGHL
ncbi:MAG: nitronate monooxygenase, partial [Candidatus Gracilibacteria bacterium]|nr:nitronate monooxygenase [Candidatus Gracilibacteria bacterium]